jgi:enoyl-CoA hydratase/carnithine racemase
VTEPLVRVETAGRAVVVRLDRPQKLNALSHDVETQLDAAFRSDAVRDASAVVVAGEGRAFCAGADVSEFVDASPGGILAYYETLGEVYERIATLPQPTIGAIHGYCLGGGFELALALDLRVADETATFGLPEVAIGIVPSSGGTYRLTRALGPARAKELILLRDRFDATEALRLGVVTEVVEAGGALPRALEMAEALAALPPLAVRVAKRAIDAAAESPRHAALAVERLAYAALSQTHDADEAARAFVEKREPRFEGR